MGRQLKDTEGVRGFRYESEVVMVQKHVGTLLKQGRQLSEITGIGEKKTATDALRCEIWHGY